MGKVLKFVVPSSKTTLEDEIIKAILEEIDRDEVQASQAKVTNGIPTEGTNEDTTNQLV